MKVEPSMLAANMNGYLPGCGSHCDGNRDRESTKERSSVECPQSGSDPREGAELELLLWDDRSLRRSLLTQERCAQSSLRDRQRL